MSDSLLHTFSTLLSNDGVMKVILLVPIFLFSLCFHEFAHAWLAFKRGDPTAALAGRLTLHPFAHADLVGTVILPVLCIYSGAPFFGWAKPVPIDPRNFKGGRRDIALVAGAGPFANVVLSLVATLLLAILLRLPIQSRVIETVITFAFVSIRVNLMLAFFNLIPIPPLDGFNIIQGISPARFSLFLHKLSRHAMLILFLLLFTGGFRIISIPVSYFTHTLYGWAGLTD